MVHLFLTNLNKNILITFSQFFPFLPICHIQGSKLLVSKFEKMPMKAFKILNSKLFTWFTSFMKQPQLICLFTFVVICLIISASATYTIGWLRIYAPNTFPYFATLQNKNNQWPIMTNDLNLFFTDTVIWPWGIFVAYNVVGHLYTG